MEERDSVWTSAKQIERLLKPSAEYLNLNPYEVLQLEFGLSREQEEEKSKQLFKKVCMCVWYVCVCVCVLCVCCVCVCVCVCVYEWCV